MWLKVIKLDICLSDELIMIILLIKHIPTNSQSFQQKGCSKSMQLEGKAASVYISTHSNCIFFSTL